jgi:hypothetical protein
MNRHHQTATAHRTPPDARGPGTSNVVDLVTTFRNLKTKTLKTVTPKKHTILSPVHHFCCNAERVLLSTPSAERRAPNAVLLSIL